MTVTLDELCERLGMNEAMPEKAFRGRSAPFELQAIWYDRSALPSTKVVATIACDRLKGAESAVELGFGTGFRLLYYALNNPETQFTAIDKEPHNAQELHRRIKRLGIRNIKVILGDMRKMQDKYAVVLGIDCFTPTKTAYAEIIAEIRMNLSRSANMVDRTKQPAFFCTPFYDHPRSTWEDQHEFYEKIFREANLPKLEMVTFGFRKLSGEPYRGRMLFAMP